MYRCKICKDIDHNNFFDSNKSSCKNCISCRDKVKRRTVKPEDLNVMKFCKNSGMDFQQICIESGENDKTKLSSQLSLLLNNKETPSPILSHNQLSQVSHNQLSEVSHNQLSENIEEIEENFKRLERLIMIQNEVIDELKQSVTTQNKFIQEVERNMSRKYDEFRSDVYNKIKIDNKMRDIMNNVTLIAGKVEQNEKRIQQMSL